MTTPRTWADMAAILRAQQAARAAFPQPPAPPIRYAKKPDLDKVRRAMAAVGVELEQERQARIAARDGATSSVGRTSIPTRVRPTREEPRRSRPTPQTNLGKTLQAKDLRTTRRWVLTAHPRDKDAKPHVETVTGDHQLDLALARLERDPAYARIPVRPA